MKKTAIFKDLSIRMRNNHEEKLVQFKNDVAECQLFNLTYNIKWQFEDLVRTEELYKKYSEIVTAMETHAPDQDEVIAWLETDAERSQNNINRLNLNNSTGAMHNVYEFAKLKAEKEWMDFCIGQIKYLNEREKK